MKDKKIFDAYKLILSPPSAKEVISSLPLIGEQVIKLHAQKYVVKTKKGLRRLTPVELERLNMFPDNHTACNKDTSAKRAFFMGNALLVGVVEALGKALQLEVTGKKVSGVQSSI